jgi:hypothetical protein
MNADRAEGAHSRSDRDPDRDRDHDHDRDPDQLKPSRKIAAFIWPLSVAGAATGTRR